MRLFVAEKPKLGRLIAKCLPGTAAPERNNQIAVGDDVVTWCFGHMLEMAEPEDYDPAHAQWSMTALPIIPEDWQLLEKGETEAQIKVISKLLASASVVVNAGDPDREGQLLVDELLDHLGCRVPVQRIWVKAQNEVGVKQALAELRDNREYHALRQSAEARQRADWLVGMNLSRAYTLAGRDAGYDGVLSIGRVQTPTLALVVERDLTIENFQPRDFFVVIAEVASGGKPFSARWRPGDAVQLDDGGRLLDRGVAQGIAERIAGQPAMVSDFEAVEKRKAPPLPWSLASLQAAANKRFGLGAQQVLDIVQELYEAGLVSYPRTDCRYLPESQLAVAGKILASLPAIYADLVAQADLTLKSAAWNDKKVTAHDAIIPIAGGAGADTLAGGKAQIFDLITRAYLAQFFPPATFRQTTITLQIAGETFLAKGRVPLSAGWKVVFDEAADEEEEQDAGDDQTTQELPALIKGGTGACSSATIEEKRTTPPARFTEGTLIEAMMNVHRLVEDPAMKARLKETIGLGTDATRANILETLKDRGFLAAKGKLILSTTTARRLVAAVPDAVKSVGLTGLFEQALEGVAEGSIAPADFLARQAAFVTAQVEYAKTAQLDIVSYPCPICRKGHLRRRKSQKGVFWGCSRYTEGCQAVFQDQGGKPSMGRSAR